MLVSSNNPSFIILVNQNACEPTSNHKSLVKFKTKCSYKNWSAKTFELEGIKTERSQNIFQNISRTMKVFFQNWICAMANFANLAIYSGPR